MPALPIHADGPAARSMAGHADDAINGPHGAVVSGHAPGTTARATERPSFAPLALAIALVLTAGCSSSSSDSDGTSASDDDPMITDDAVTDAPPVDETNNPAVITPPATGGSTVPTLDPFADPVPGPDPSDPFGATLEQDDELPMPGGAPTQPKNLRVALISNDWAELDWAPARDDSAVVAYRLYRSDGHVYEIRGDLVSSNGGTQNELNKNWTTTSFIDCNYTRFLDRVYDCAVHGPSPGDTFSYQITAVDDAGQESIRSNTVTVRYHDERNAPVPIYEDFYLDGDDRFAQEHDLSNTANFLDEFQPVFEDEFELGYIDGAKWNTSLTWGDGTIINGEQQYFVDTQRNPSVGFFPFEVADSTLTIRAIPTPDDAREQLPDACREDDPTGAERCAFLSGALSSHDLFGLTYGYVEGHMKMSDASGALSSFYLYHRFPGTGVQRHGPEIDIVEYLGENPFGDEDAFQTYHFEDPVTGVTRSAPTMNHKNADGERYDEDFHTYGVLWEPQLVIWYIDGEEVRRLSGPQISRQQMNIVTYLVTGSEWAPTPDIGNGTFPIELEIDWIRAYQRPVFNGNGVYPLR